MSTNIAPPHRQTSIMLGEAVMAAYDAYYAGAKPVLPGYDVGDSIHVSEALLMTFFGFVATAKDKSHVIVALRGTASNSATEVAVDLNSWGTNTPCILPYGGNQSYGSVNMSLYKFYGAPGSLVPSMADSLKKALARALNGVGPTAPIYITAHSLGGGVATLAALDVFVSGVTTGRIPILYTFASIHVGEQSFANAFNKKIPVAYRFANLSDFVPALVGISDDAPGYVHVGLECTFVWQTWMDWANHSMKDIYLPTITKNWGVLTFGPVKYPASVSQGTMAVVETTADVGLPSGAST